MKVILLQDVAKIGRRFEVADVPAGHALNMLIPKKMAEPATKENMKRIKARAEKAAEGRAANAEEFKTALDTLKGKTITLKVQANEKGHMFEAVKSPAIAEAIKAEGAVIAADQIVIAEPIKEVGMHTVTLSDGESTSSLSLEVTA